MGARHQDQADVRRVQVGRLRVHPRNIRTTITGIDELAISIRYEGVLEPLIAHKKFVASPGVQDLELIAGHRRLAAAEVAGLKTVPVIVVPEHTDDEAMLAMLAENVHRVDVDAEDLGAAVENLHQEFGLTWQQIADRLGMTVAQLNSWRSGRQLRANAERHPGKQAQPARPKPPPVGARKVHAVLARWDSGQITDPADLIEDLRALLGGWTPEHTDSPGEAPQLQSVPPPSGEHRPLGPVSGPSYLRGAAS